MATNYTSDGTYWTGRERSGYLEVVRVKSDNYAEVESWGAYSKRGSAVAAAAELGYYQGRRDAAAELRSTLLDALEAAGLGPAAVAQGDIGPEEAAKLEVTE